MERGLNRNPGNDLGPDELGRTEQRIERVEAALAVRDDDDLLLGPPKNLQKSRSVVLDTRRSIERLGHGRQIPIGDSLRIEVLHLPVERDEASCPDRQIDPRKRIGNRIADGNVDVPSQGQVDVHVERARGVLERLVDLVFEVDAQLLIKLGKKSADEEHFLPFIQDQRCCRCGLAHSQVDSCAP